MYLSEEAIKKVFSHWRRYITTAIVSACGYMTNVFNGETPEVMLVRAEKNKAIPGYWKTGRRSTPSLVVGRDITWKAFVEEEAKKRTQEAFPGYEDEVGAIIREDYVPFDEFVARMRPHMEGLTDSFLNFCQLQYRIRVQGIQDVRCHDATLVVWEQIKRARRPEPIRWNNIR